MATKMKWELRMNKAREMRVQGSKLLHSRVELLVSCYNDTGFRSWHAEHGTDELDFLDFELSDTAASFLTLKAVLDAYPDSEAWSKHNIRDLIAEVMAKEMDAKKRDNETNRISWKERALAAEAECERLRAENTTIKELMSSVASAKCK